VASGARVPLDNRGIPRFEARRLRISRRSVRNACAPLLYRRTASARSDGRRSADSIAEGTVGLTRPRTCSRGLEPRAR
jgi:hypothetical protein